jgi:hypothetical protein
MVAARMSRNLPKGGLSPFRFASHFRHNLKRGLSPFRFGYFTEPASSPCTK